MNIRSRDYRLYNAFKKQYNIQEGQGYELVAINFLAYYREYLNENNLMLIGITKYEKLIKTKSKQMKKKQIPHKMIEKIKVSNNILYILELNKFNEKEIRQVFNNVLEMKKSKDKGDIF